MIFSLKRNALFAAFSLFLLFTATAIQAQTTVFTYQGKLTDTSMPVSGTYDFQFVLYSAVTAGSPQSSTQTKTGVVVTNGIFAVELDFGSSAFPGTDRFLEIRVKRQVEANYTPLVPRQRITSAPYANRAISSAFSEMAQNANTATEALTVGGQTAANVATATQAANAATSSATPNTIVKRDEYGIFSGFDINATRQFNIGGIRVLAASSNGGNTWVGSNAGSYTNGGTDNTIVGSFAGYANTGINNVFVGVNTGTGNTGANNVFVGTAAGLNNTAGGGNTFIGRDAGLNNTTGSNNVAIGSNAQVGQNLQYATAIGNGASATQNDSIVLGTIFDTVRIPGKLVVTGSVAKGSGSFKIDHPLDPKNKYLYHSFVESPEMMNVYNGNIKTDKRGVAIVKLPDYFEALNRDFRYQLTVLGVFAQAIVAEKIKGNVFKIKTSKPNVEVSWQVTGVRQDKFANENRITTTEDKPEAEKGKCLYAPLCGGASINEAPRRP